MTVPTEHGTVGAHHAAGLALLSKSHVSSAELQMERSDLTGYSENVEKREPPAGDPNAGADGPSSTPSEISTAGTASSPGATGVGGAQGTPTGAHDAVDQDGAAAGAADVGGGPEAGEKEGGRAAGGSAGPPPTTPWWVHGQGPHNTATHSTFNTTSSFIPTKPTPQDQTNPQVTASSLSATGASDVAGGATHPTKENNAMANKKSITGGSHSHKSATGVNSNESTIPANNTPSLGSAAGEYSPMDNVSTIPSGNETTILNGAAAGDSKKTPVGAIAGGIIGGLLGLVALLGLVFVCLLRRRRRPQYIPRNHEGEPFVIERTEPTISDHSDFGMSPSPRTYSTAQLAAIQSGRQMSECSTAFLSPVSHSRHEEDPNMLGVESHEGRGLERNPSSRGRTERTSLSFTDDYVSDDDSREIVNDVSGPEGAKVRKKLPSICLSQSSRGGT